VKGSTFELAGATEGGGFKSGAITTVVASGSDPAVFTLTDTANGLSWSSDLDTITAAVTEGTFTENMDKITKLPDGTINFKLTTTIAGRLSNGFSGRLVVVFTGVGNPLTVRIDLHPRQPVGVIGQSFFINPLLRIIRLAYPDDAVFRGVTRLHPVV
jgi:hypothetical protein